MTVVLALAAGAAALTPAVIRHMDLTPADYPSDALLRGQQARVGVVVIVTPEGKPETCRLAQPSGVETLDLTTCRVVLRQARYDPARDGEGRATYARSRYNFAWTLGGVFGALPPLPDAPDYAMTIRPRPGESAEPVTVSVDTLIGEDGALLSCSVPDKADAPALAHAACRVLPSVWVADPVTAVDGTPVRCIATVTVRFTTQG